MEGTSPHDLIRIGTSEPVIGESNGIGYEAGGALQTVTNSRRASSKQVGRNLVLILFAITGLVAVLLVLLAAIFFISDGYSSGGVAVVRMEGEMVTGKVDTRTGIGSEVVGEELRRAADDPTVRAIVLRVNSPGGTPAAAEEIITDLEYAKSKKPVVVSMGDLAASAAYYVSAHADRIYANPDTLTGAVGVIWEFEDVSRWMEIEGYNVSVVKSGIRKDMGSQARPLSTEERAYAQQIVDESFRDLLTDILLERSRIQRSDIDDGRIIRGMEAKRLHVIDEIGNLNDAIEGAKELAEKRVHA
jgi:protease-4